MTRRRSRALCCGDGVGMLRSFADLHIWCVMMSYTTGYWMMLVLSLVGQIAVSYYTHAHIWVMVLRNCID